MAKKSNTTKRRTKVKNLPVGEKELTAAEKKKVKGGSWIGIKPQPHEASPKKPEGAGGDAVVSLGKLN